MRNLVLPKELRLKGRDWFIWHEGVIRFGVPFGVLFEVIRHFVRHGAVAPTAGDAAGHLVAAAAAALFVGYSWGTGMWKRSETNLERLADHGDPSGEGGGTDARTPLPAPPGVPGVPDSPPGARQSRSPMD